MTGLIFFLKKKIGTCADVTLSRTTLIIYNV